MEVFTTIAPLKVYLKHKNFDSVGLVPTMGALHAGHLSLVQESKKENQFTVVSIFVNPTQFNNPADLEKYPRTMDTDVAMLQQNKCNVVFAPSVSEMYDQPSILKFDFSLLDKILEGKSRPGHFSGVALVVSKLFNIIHPTRAYFGQKDFQQLKIVERLVSELKFDLQVKSSPIFREADGLAMSSRNARLNPIERKNAVVFYESLLMAKELLTKGTPIESVKKLVVKKCNSTDGVTLDYFELANPETLSAIKIVSHKNILLIAGVVGDVRLIDNLIFYT